jgi:hypothetical protein
MLTDSRSRLQAKLLAQPDELTDLRIIWAEWNNTKAQMEEADRNRRARIQVAHEFGSYEERAAYIELVEANKTWGARYYAAQQTVDSLEQSLKMMADDLPLETLDALLQELGEVSHAPV